MSAPSLNWRHCWPHAVPIETHISLVLLDGDFAWKIKKPVQLPFLDFSTLALRRHYCEEELRINRRSAPDVYLDVLPLTGSAQAPVLAGSGEPIEWVLRMRCFPPHSLFSDLAAEGRLQAWHIDALAEQIALLHLGQAPLAVAPAKDVTAWTLESVDEIAALHPDATSPARLAAMRSAVQRLIGGQGDWRARRLAGGWLREGHGDLHLGNLVVWHQRVLAFDAIEFDPALRCIDVISDAAFAYMDLLAVGLPAFALRFINAYVERSGDYAGLAGLRAFSLYRALVRAKVALLCGDVGRFARYWSVAESFAAAPPPPRLFLTMGLSGSGKSMAAQMLVEALAEAGIMAVRLRSDVERKRLLGLPPTARPDPALAYSAEATRRTYRRLAGLADALLGDGFSVVVDAAFLRQGERESFRRIAENRRVPFRLLEVVAGMPLMEERLVARNLAADDASDADVEVLHRQSAEPVPRAWAAVHRVIDNEGSRAELSDRLESLLREPV
ncbi:AAA family ATPase [Rhodocyclus purpureus]|uniref:bifunctional aminoglycoside phosphotransferase/ATP-binding protein n=1 Tax=Rhodocyclus purpureus TaxID=1067 RepID=UPI001912BAE8|nr:bifunctional aminoglycoside phosphotransferase/ATP-binding protein [Rhodocyclus purpureus]MBK5914910.1 hypothetical protein [Rhodocyclus purpureus]